MKKYLISIALLIIGLFIFINIIQLLRPWFRSNEKIKSDFLQEIPIGTSWKEIVKIIENKDKWYISTSEGLVPCSTYYQDYDYLNENFFIITQNLYLHDYGHPFYYNIFGVCVRLKFDEDFKLTEVEVEHYLRI